MSKYRSNTESENSTQKSIAHGTVGTANELDIANKLKKIELLIKNDEVGMFGSAQLKLMLEQIN